jgi:hypothetical protein
MKNLVETIVNQVVTLTIDAVVKFITNPKVITATIVCVVGFILYKKVKKTFFYA